MRRNRYESHVFRLEPVERCPMQCMYGGGDGDRVTMTPTALVACNAMPQPLKWKRHLSREESSPLTGALERMVLVAIQRRTMRFIYYNSSGAVETILVICQRLWYIKFYWCICDIHRMYIQQVWATVAYPVERPPRVAEDDRSEDLFRVCGWCF